MGLAAIAPSPELFGLSRFIGGIGLGGVIPTASALTVEYSPKKAIFYLCSYVYWLSFRYRVRCYFVHAYVRRFRMENYVWYRNDSTTPHSFHYSLFTESIQFLLSRNRQEEVNQILNRFQIEFHVKDKTHQDPSTIRKKMDFYFILKRIHKSNATFWITYIMGMFLIYGLNTWLPQMMRQAGYPLGSSLSFLLINITAAIGALFAGAIADRIGAKLLLASLILWQPYVSDY